MAFRAPQTFSLKISGAVLSCLTFDPVSGFLFQKRKLSWPDPRDAGGVPAKRKHHQQEHGRCDAPPLTAAATCLPPSPKKQTPPGEERPHLTGGRRDAGQTLTDSHCRVIRWLWSNGKHQNPNPELPSCESPAMQDSSVSSSNGVAAALLNLQ